ncbi:hypothetical protein RND81_14G027800 [Saponaria officinalis]|uniref:Uncharacterized protein n=1 Tax=Saponaria officinalis TaxID=3572 RepID=A0AAW1GL37_SAPOF
MDRELVEGSSSFNLVGLQDFLGCWMFDYEDRSPRCRSVFSIGNKPFWPVFRYFFLRFLSVSTSCSCLLMARSSRWLVEIASIADNLDDDSRAQFTVLHQHVITRCRLLVDLDWFSSKTPFVMFYIVVYKYGSLSHTTRM